MLSSCKTYQKKKSSKASLVAITFYERIWYHQCKFFLHTWRDKRSIKNSNVAQDILRRPFCLHSLTRNWNYCISHYITFQTEHYYCVIS